MNIEKNIQKNSLPSWLVERYENILKENNLTWDDVQPLVITNKAYGIGVKNKGDDNTQNNILYWVPKSQINNSNNKVRDEKDYVSSHEL